ncbi:type IV pilus modification PilV family protein [Lachnoclostridium edouardi]|uniref:type IV pilus modification PilV family protein n=1 Tax=Lachnoclostridium edouardi TaxID=1926283 RepID=UPI000C7BF8FE|nr:type II secretion system protein [Lachnoclostridium edouardi]
MRKKEAGFTLIEVLVAMTVLSLMAAVLMQVFLFSSRVSRKAMIDERIMNLSRDGMETVKNYSLSNLEEKLSDKDSVNLEISGHSWTVSRKGNKKGQNTGYVLEREAAEYFPVYTVKITAEYDGYADQTESAGSTEYANCYEMPEISQIVSQYNAIVSPEDMVIYDLLLMEKMEGIEEHLDNQNELEGDVRRYINITCNVDQSNQAQVAADLIYTLDQGERNKPEEFKSNITTSAVCMKTKLLMEQKEDGSSVNGIYLFLPEEFLFDGIFAEMKANIPLYIIAPQKIERSGYNSISAGFFKASGLSAKGLQLFTNLNIPGSRELIDVEKPYNRLYKIQVTVSSQEENGKAGETLLKLESTKRE